MSYLPKNYSKATALFLSLLLFFSNMLCYAIETNLRKTIFSQKTANKLTNLNDIEALTPSEMSNQALPPTRQHPIEDLAAFPEASLVLSAIPTRIGTIRKIIPPDQAQTNIVIHVQDVHMNKDAQHNISTLVKVLADKNKVDLVALEGAFSPLNFQAYQQFPFPAAVKIMSNFLLEENKISGPIYTAFNLSAKNKNPQFIGIDDSQHHLANINAYKLASASMRSKKNEIISALSKLNTLKSKELNFDLANFDQSVIAQSRDEISLGEFLQGARFYAAFGRLKQSENFLIAFEMEKNLNFKQVEIERSQLIEALIYKLSRSEIAELSQRSLDFRSGEIHHSEFYLYLRNLTDRHRLSLLSYPAMNDYIKYLLLSDSIDGEKLFAEVDQIKSTIYNSLIRNSSEKNLIARSRHILLAEKLIDFSLTQQEWREYKILSEDIDHSSLAAFEKFYEEAQIRDGAMAANLLDAMKNNKNKTVILVTGGFHSEGIDERLKKAGCLVIDFIPKIERVETENGSGYLSVFNQEKTPLEQLFKGEKLFLSQDLETNLAAAAPITVAAALQLGAALNDAPNLFKILHGQFDRRIKVTATKLSNAVLLTIEKTNHVIEILVRFIHSDRISSVAQYEAQDSPATWFKNKTYEKKFKWIETPIVVYVAWMMTHHFHVYLPMNVIAGGMFWFLHLARGEGVTPLTQPRVILFFILHFIAGGIVDTYGFSLSSSIPLILLTMIHQKFGSPKENKAVTPISLERQEIARVVNLLNGTVTSQGLDPAVIIPLREARVENRIDNLADNFKDGRGEIVTYDTMSQQMKLQHELVLKRFKVGLGISLNKILTVSLPKIRIILQEAFFAKIYGNATKTLPDRPLREKMNTIIVVNQALADNIDALRQLIRTAASKNKGSILLLGETVNIYAMLLNNSIEIPNVSISSTYNSNLFNTAKDSAHPALILSALDTALARFFNEMTSIQVITPLDITIDTSNLSDNSILKKSAVYIALNESLRFTQLNFIDIDRLDKLARLFNSSA